jgi:hypothetical protein
MKPNRHHPLSLTRIPPAVREGAGTARSERGPAAEGIRGDGQGSVRRPQLQLNDDRRPTPSESAAIRDAGRFCGDVGVQGGRRAIHSHFRLIPGNNTSLIDRITFNGSVCRFKATNTANTNAKPIAIIVNPI